MVHLVPVSLPLRHNHHHPEEICAFLPPCVSWFSGHRTVCIYCLLSAFVSFLFRHFPMTLHNITRRPSNREPCVCWRFECSVVVMVVVVISALAHVLNLHLCARIAFHIFVLSLLLSCTPNCLHKLVKLLLDMLLFRESLALACSLYGIPLQTMTAICAMCDGGKQVRCIWPHRSIRLSVVVVVGKFFPVVCRIRAFSRSFL